MKLTKNAKTILERFLLRNEKLEIIETPENLIERVAGNIAKEDRKYGNTEKEILETEKKFFGMMNALEFLPNLPAISNAGRELQQLAACFVLPVDDSMESIFQAVKNLALIQKSGGGTGFNFSKLRPEGSVVRETLGTASGPISFMKVFDSATAAIKEGGIRRGANMGILSIDHPDIEKFISCKQSGDFQNFNISVALTEKFMEAVIKNKKFDLSFKNKVCKTIDARKLFENLSYSAWLTGDPGVVFLDEINKFNPTPALGMIESTNPCAEMPLLPYESCILGSVNLARFVRKNRTVDYSRLESVISAAVHFLDNAIDANLYPLRETERITKANRKIGLGIMGFADMLIMLGIQYDSSKAAKLAEKLMKFFREKSNEASRALAEKRKSFPNIDRSVYIGEKMRNATRTTIAPTGVISIIADCSQGIEPLFGIIFKRNSSYGTLYEINPLFRESARKLRLKKDVLDKIASEGSLQSINIPKKFKKLFRTAHDISPEWHVKIQAAFQKYTDNAVSKTVNLKESATIEDVKKVFLLAHKLGLKGLTIYRYNSKPAQVLEFCEKCGKI